ncbi:hypothetical protein TWF225_005167 [Orbilia oligospora]|nr:hypothetical protein TWF103_000668 [Orbilia oligospora]KAF3128726.1 hypothetical protein TWF594_011478 [Orbilia oligospora]KAF3185377.1 hypothetical protein TWF225_005167 [Orbilia oligospora]KAF3258172.1 hypothetical protein TWF217_005863 [Orbilia oligospora]KAF3270257.1 hypothetical protein TWF128_004062 [Orbilia oligospora]
MRLKVDLDTILKPWFRMLSLAQQSPPSWYRDRIREELQERRIAKSKLHKLSETSDVLFAISRARYDGFPIHKLPPFTIQHFPVYAYMLAKYSSRWGFYRMAAVLCKAPQYNLVREVVNPGKDHKLNEVSSRHNLNQEEFRRVGRRLRRFWPLLP